jgi:Ser/Thr protein kinase RdoA (MazF antagonist)
MKPYNELTKRGKLRRQRQLALKALEHYDLDVKDFRLLAAGINTIYRIDTQGGEKYAMRIYSPEETVLQDNQAEIFWLKALNKDTDLRVPEPIPQRSGAYITIQNHPNIPDEHRCVIFNWIPGRSLEYYLSPENYYKLGEIMARLHKHAESLFVPPKFNPNDGI